jgi:hypothetical protein
MKNLKRFKDFLLESSNYIELDLDFKTEDLYMEILLGLASLPDVYEEYGASIWVGIADDVTYTDFIEMNPENEGITKGVYNSYRSKYKEAIRKNPKQEKIDEIIIALSGEYDRDLFNVYSDKPIEWWKNQLDGFPPNIPLIAKSLWDEVNLIEIKFKKIK